MIRRSAMLLACACLLAQGAAVFADEDVPSLIHALHAKKAERRRDAALALGAMGPDAKDAVPALIDVLKTDSDHGVRLFAAASLGAIGPDARDSVPALIDALKADSDIVVRRTAASALGAIGPDAKDAVPALLDVLKTDGDELVRYCAGLSLGNIHARPKAVIPALIECLKMMRLCPFGAGPPAVWVGSAPRRRRPYPF